MSSTVHSTLLVAVDQLLLGHQHLFGLSFCRLGYSLGWQPQLLGALQENQHGLGRPKSHPPWMSNIQPGSTQGVLEKHIWVWVNTYRYHFYWDEHPFTSYFDVHQGYKVLTHCHMKACQGDFFICFSHIFLFIDHLGNLKSSKTAENFKYFNDFSGNLMEISFFLFLLFWNQAWLWCWANLWDQMGSHRRSFWIVRWRPRICWKKGKSPESSSRVEIPRAWGGPKPLKCGRFWWTPEYHKRLGKM